MSFLIAGMGGARDLCRVGDEMLDSAVKQKFLDLGFYAAVLLLGTTAQVSAAEQPKKDVQGISLGMPLKEAIKLLAEKKCAPIRQGKGSAPRRSTLEDFIECNIPGKMDNFTLYYSKILPGNPVWVIQYIFESKLMSDQLCAAG